MIIANRRQRVERVTLNHKVVGSTPTSGLTATFFCGSLPIFSFFFVDCASKSLPHLIGYAGKRSKLLGRMVSNGTLYIRVTWSGGTHACHKIYVPTYRSSPHHGKLAQSGPRDDGFRSGLNVFSTYTSEPPAE